MKSVEIVGFKRANLGKTSAKELRLKAEVPCVLYGGKEQIHFAVPMYLFRALVYTPDAHTVDLNVEGDKYKAILQDIQFHPVNDIILHADFLLLDDNKQTRMEVPVKVMGNSVGVAKGGKLVQKLRKVKISALPKDLPNFVSIDVSDLDLGKTVKVSAIKTANYKILNPPSVPVVSIDIPRALKGQKEG
jgi:large subunit ribosomal protein L25